MATIDGTAGDDTLNGTIDADTITGQAGDDSIDGGAGGDSIDGGAGADTIEGGSGNDTITGGSETINPAGGIDILSGGDDADTFLVFENFGNDTIIGGEGGDDHDTIDLSNLTGPVTVIYDDTASGTITDGTFTITFSQIEHLILTDHDDSVDASLDNDGLFGDQPGVIIDAGDGNDTITGGRGGDTIDGGAGDDVIDAGYGDDSVDGGTGENTLAANLGDDTLGNDTMVGGDGNDYIDGGIEADTLIGNAGLDTIKGGEGDDELYGGEGADSLSGEDDADTFFISDNFGNDTIIGGEGGDDLDTINLEGLSGSVTVNYDGTSSGTITDGTHTITFSEIEAFILPDWADIFDASLDNSASPDGIYVDVGAQDDSVIGGTGDDTVLGGTGNDTIIAGDGDDSLLAGSGSDSVEGGDGDDFIDGVSGANTLSGGAGHDTIEGGQDSETIFGGTGDDSISADRGADVLDGGIGNDSIFGEMGNDSIDGGDGDDSLSGGIGADSIEGGDGNDTIDGDSGSDTIFGGAGEDILSGGSGNDSLSGGDDYDSIEGGSGSDTIDAGEGNDDAFGGDGDDSIFGGIGHDLVVGDEGDDTLHGDDGDDIVSGHEGDDALHGGAGSDNLFGGSGEDYFDGGTDDDFYHLDRNDGGGDNDLSQSDRDVVRFEPGMDHDTAFDFHGEADFIYIGSTPKSDINFTQLDADTWVLTIDGFPNDSLTIHFVLGTQPDSAGDLSNQLVTDSEYTPPSNGNPAIWSMTCFTAKARILTPLGMCPIGKLKKGDMVITADRGSQPVLDILKTRISPTLLVQQPALRPIVIDAGAFGTDLPQQRMHVSRQHAFAVFGGKALVRAVHLADDKSLARVQKNRPNAITYLHLLLPHHELVQVDGVWTESYFLNPKNCNDLAPETDFSKPNIFVHDKRCRPLLSRADLRSIQLRNTDIGRLNTQTNHLAQTEPDDQSAPNILPALATASAPVGVSP
ncbi:MAG: Hint domain-containing protein [Sulfitobacter sp.]